MSSSQAFNAHTQSLELIERFAQCLLKECKSKSDLVVVKQLASFITFFDNEIQMNHKRNQIFDSFVNKVDCATEKPDCNEILKEFYEEIDRAKKQLSNNKKSEKYNNFMKMLSEQDLGEDDDDDNDDDAEIRTVSEIISTVDPISKLPMVDPVKNKICGHTYDKPSILQLIQQNPRTRCPIAGCSAADFVKRSDLIPNNTLKRILSNINSNSSKKFKSQE